MGLGNLAEELVKIITSGDLSYAQDYYEGWCKDAQWSRAFKGQIQSACAAWGVDPGRFGAAHEEVTQRGEPIVYIGDDSVE
jgi:hypothetical protein